MSAETQTPRAFGRRLRVFREMRGLSQEGLAEMVSSRGHRWVQATVWKLESGSRELKFSEALSLAAALGVPLPSLAVVDEMPFVSPVPPSSPATVADLDAAVTRIENLIQVAPITTADLDAAVERITGMLRVAS